MEEWPFPDGNVHILLENRHIDIVHCPFSPKIAEAGKSNKASDGTPKSESRSGRLSLSDVLYHSEAKSDAFKDGPRSKIEDTDFDEELELDFETSMSGDEAHDVESNILHGSLYLKIHRRGVIQLEKLVYTVRVDLRPHHKMERLISFSFPSLPEAVINTKRRYVGHRNVGTDIKLASFLGQRVANCVQCHPFDCFVATSGIDNTVKLWSPTAAVPSMIAGGSAGPESANVVIGKLSSCRPFELLERFRMHEFSEGSLQPFVCAQS